MCNTIFLKNDSLRDWLKFILRTIYQARIYVLKLINLIIACDRIWKASKSNFYELMFN